MTKDELPVRCRFCDGKMKFEFFGTSSPGSPDFSWTEMCYRCESCGATSPRVKNEFSVITSVDETERYQMAIEILKTKCLGLSIEALARSNMLRNTLTAMSARYSRLKSVELPGVEREIAEIKKQLREVLPAFPKKRDLLLAASRLTGDLARRMTMRDTYVLEVARIRKTSADVRLKIYQDAETPIKPEVP